MKSLENKSGNIFIHSQKVEANYYTLIKGAVQYVDAKKGVGIQDNRNRNKVLDALDKYDKKLNEIPTDNTEERSKILLEFEDAVYDLMKEYVKNCQYSITGPLLVDLADDLKL